MLSFCAMQHPISGSSQRHPWTRPMFRSIASRLHAYRSRRNDIRQLQLMDDRELADIGVGRADIARAVRFGR
ncbi:MAG TPA: DUF1127 domain-containing protein [Aurantimonas sp.]